MSNILAIIPARSGSKGLKDKNIRKLNGRPMIAYTIEAAQKSGVFKDILVSTDSEEYAEIARKYGAYVPFLRSEKSSSDKASTNEVIEEVLMQLEGMGKIYDEIMILQPTSPLRDENDIKEAAELFRNKNANCVVSMCECEHSPLLSRKLNDENNLDGFLSDLKILRRQDMGAYYRLNGAIYMLNVNYFLKYKDFYKKDSYAYIMDKFKSVDIDDIFDFKFAEFIIKNKTFK